MYYFNAEDISSGAEAPPPVFTECNVYCLQVSKRLHARKAGSEISNES